MDLLCGCAIIVTPVKGKAETKGGSDKSLACGTFMRANGFDKRHCRNSAFFGESLKKRDINFDDKFRDILACAEFKKIVS